MKIKITLMLLCLISLTYLKVEAQDAPLDTLTRAVESLQQREDIKDRLKISGYIQAQFQITDSAGSRGFAGGNFDSGVDKRFHLRRGRIKFQYTSPSNDKGWSTSQYVLQFDVTQAGMTIKDAYAKFTDPWSGWFSITAGMQNRPFGYDIIMSSSVRESPERGRMSQIIMPNERDLGGMLTIQGPKQSMWNWVKIDLGLFNGTGAPSAGANTSDFDKFKDFIGHLGLSKASKSEMIKWGLGASLYDGGFRQDVSNLYSFGTDDQGVKGFKIEKNKSDVNPNIALRKRVKRQYIGFDGQLSIDWFLGLTTIRAEYIQGTQTATYGSSTSPNSPPVSVVTTNSTYVVTDTSGATQSITTSTTSTVASDLYSRKFNGAYFYFVQNIGHSPFQVVLKYDWYDPNTDVSGDEIGKSVTGNLKPTNATDIKFDTYGFGLVYRWDANVKITAYYDLVKNETSQNLSGWTRDIPDNVFTLRTQIKF